VKLLRGRMFRPVGQEPTPVAIVNETFVQRFGDGGDVLGRVVQRNERPPIARFEIIGVVADTRERSLVATPRQAVYTLLEHMPLSSLSVAVRAQDTNGVARTLRGMLRDLDPDVPIVVESMATKIDRQDARRHFFLAMLSIFGGLAAVLAAVGIYGVMTHVVDLRMRELGIRVALGATSGQIRSTVIARGFKPLAIGLAGGAVAAWWVAGLLQTNAAFNSQLFRVRAQDPVTLVATPLALLMVGLLACWLPALRTRQLNPIDVLKAD
jgi:putative ABC transport system permease protein